jgi:nitronate monooxygenase
MLQTHLCVQLGIEYPVFSVGFDAGAGPQLAAAVSNAGGCGVLGGTSYKASSLREQIRRLRQLTDRPFGVNLILVGIQEDQISTCLAERVPILVFFWGDARPYVEDAHRHDVKVFIQVGSVAEARAAADAGVDAIIAQGAEAGGHVKGTTALSVLVPEVVEAVKPLPVIAAGGIADGKGLAAALCLGAQAVSMGTRFVASDEAFIPRAYKERVVASTSADTVFSELFDLGWPNAPHRAIRNEVIRQWEAVGRPSTGQRSGEGTFIRRRTRAGETRDIPRYTAFQVTPEFEGDLELAPLWAGQSCSLIKDIKPAAQIVHAVVQEAAQIIQRLSGLV